MGSLILSLRHVSAGAALGVMLVGCSYFPRAVDGLPMDRPWVALPLRTWLAEHRAEPEAMAICRPPECGPGLVVSVVRLVGDDAKAAAALLARPEPLARSLRKAKPNATVRTLAAVRRLQVGEQKGFALTLERADGSRPPAYGAALGQIAGEDLRVVLVIGENEEEVEATLRRVAVEHLGS